MKHHWIPSFFIALAILFSGKASATDWLESLHTHNLSHRQIEGTVFKEKSLSYPNIWRTKFIGDDNRKLSNFSFVVFIYQGAHEYRGRASGFIVGRRHIVSVSHAFAESGRWKINNSVSIPSEDEFGNYWIWVEACGTRYQVRSVKVGTQSDLKNLEKDYSVIELKRNLCSMAKAASFGMPTAPIEGDLIASGYYRPASVKNQTGIFKFEMPYTPSADNFTGDIIPNRPMVYEQYSDAGSLGKRFDIRDQQIYRYLIDQTLGGSGGPIFKFINSEPVIIGIQFYEPTEEIKKYNYSIAASGPFLEFVKKHVPDLNIPN